MIEQTFHPYPRLSPEYVFNQVIKALGGQRVDEIVDGAIDWDNADYIIRGEDVVAELKELHSDVSEDEASIARVSEIYNKWASKGRVPKIDGKNSIRIDLLPNPCQQEILKFLKRKIEGPVRKAAKQIKTTKDKLGMTSAKGLLILVNEGSAGLRPDIMFFFLSHILKNQYSAIDQVIYCTVNLPMEGPGIPDQALIWTSATAKGRRSISVDFMHRMQDSWQRTIDSEIGLGERPRLIVEGKSLAEMSFIKSKECGDDKFVRTGGFYSGSATNWKYYCESIVGGMATLYLVESYQNGSLIQAVFHQKLIYATTALYLPIADREEIRRLKKAVKELKRS